MSVILGLDIGGTSLKLGAWRDAERLDWRPGLAVPQSADEGKVADALAGYVRQFAAELIEAPAALGVGSCGLIAGGVIFQSPNTPWDRLALTELLEHRLDWPVHLLNDADAFLLAALETLVEQRCIALGVTLGTGIGTGLWIRDQLFSGGAGVSPEGGHITLGIDRARANTGIPGSWEFMAGRGALLHYYEEAGGGRADDPADVAAAAERGEAAAVGAWLRYGRYVGAGLGSLCNVLTPDYVLIGGGLARAHELFAPSMRSALERHLLRAMPRPDIRFFTETEDTVARGAARHARMRLQRGSRH